MRYTITYYSETVQESIRKLPPTLRARYFNLADRRVVAGPNLGEPHTKAMKGGLFELRLKGAEGIARVFYCTSIGKRIVMLRGFVKKTDKTPSRELAIAVSRMKEVKNADA
jgi:phage-related protein